MISWKKSARGFTLKLKNVPVFYWNQNIFINKTKWSGLLKMNGRYLNKILLLIWRNLRLLKQLNNRRTKEFENDWLINKSLVANMSWLFRTRTNSQQTQLVGSEIGTDWDENGRSWPIVYHAQQNRRPIWQKFYGRLEEDLSDHMLIPVKNEYSISKNIRYRC